MCWHNFNKKKRINFSSIDSKAKCYITVPKDGSYGKNIYLGSGSIVSGIVLSAFSLNILNIDIADRTQTFDEALAYAKNHNYKYLISPKILHWEDRSTSWSGRPSKASIRIIVTDVGTGSIIDSVVIDARSSSARMTDPDPEDAWPKPVGEYVDSLIFN